MSGYIVALAYKPHVKGYAGVRYWTIFSDKEEFKKWTAEDKDHEVLEHGITAERGVELTKGTSVQSYLNAALHDSTDPDTGRVDLESLRHNIQKVMFGIEHSQS